MSKYSDRTPVALSRKLYERLLALYPRDYRQEYGAPMAQLFHDQCRDAWREAQAWGLTVLWLRVSIDLVKTSAAERLRNLKQRKSMFNQMIMEFRVNPRFRTTLLALFAVVFMLVFTSSVLLAFLAPEQYASTARIKAERGAAEITPERARYVVGSYDPSFVQTIFALLQSEPILGRVARRLSLADSWRKTSPGGARLTEADTIKLLRKRIDLRPVRNTSLIEVRVVSKNPKEASAIANALVETYRQSNSEQQAELLRSSAGAKTPKLRSVEIVDPAVPGLRPVRPNKPFTLFLGLFGGIVLGSVVAGVGALLVLLSRRFSRPEPATG